MAEKGFLVTVQGGKFLGFGGKLVSEYPDARKFKTEQSAQIAAAVLRAFGGLVTEVMSVAAYTGGAQ